MNRLIFLLLLSIAFGVSTTTEIWADEILLITGDRYTGKLQSLNNAVVEFHSQYDVTMKIPLGHVYVLTASSPLIVELFTGDRLLVSVLKREDGKIHIESPTLGKFILDEQNVGSVRASTDRQPEGVELASDSIFSLHGRGEGGLSTEPHSQSSSESKQPPKPIGEKPEEDIRMVFLRQSSVLLKPQEIAIDAGLIYGLKEEPIPGLLNRRQRNISLLLNLRYGLHENLEPFAVIPVEYGFFENNNFSDVTRDRAFGFGDFSAGLKFQMARESAIWPDIILSLSLTAPTGSEPVDENSVALGSGHWAVSGGMQFIKTIDPVVVFWGIDYSHLFEARRFYSASDQDVKPGEFFGYNIGMGFAINDSISLSNQVVGRFITEDKVNGETMEGTSRDEISLRMALTGRLSKNSYVEPSVTFGLSHAAQDFSIGISLTHFFR